jgi:hypothetical protein
MTSNSKLRGIISVSAASMALLQSVAHVKAESPGPSNPVETEPKRIINARTEKLILAPPHQEELLRMYAAHSSHSSHSSHVSGTGHSSHYSATTYSPPSAPNYPPANYTSGSSPQSPAVAAPPSTNSSPPRPIAQKTTDFTAETTNSTNVTNVPVDNSTTNTVNIESLTKQAAEGSSYAQCSLGLDYLYGRHGVKQNIDKAKMLFELSAAQGNAFAKERLAELNADASQPESTKK